MAKRIFSTFALWAIATLAIVYGGSLGFTALICALALGTNYEVCTLLRASALTPNLKYIQFATVVIFALSTRAVCMGAECIVSDIAAVLLMLAPLWTIVKDPFGSRFSKTVLPTVAVIFIVPFMLKWFAVTANWGTGGYENIMLAVWIIAAAKFSDVGAYVIGCAFGRHKMAPTMSPNKTWEGAICGAVSSVFTGILVWGLGLLCADLPWLGSLYSPLPLAVCVVTAVLASALGQIGDLAESLIKRMIGVKDFSNLIPGHGGMFDRADSLLFAIPTAYFCIRVASVIMKGM